MKHSKRRRNGGFVLIVMALAATALLGVLGMAVDVGRMFISKNELQVFSDAGALAAAGKLDGTSNGITKAQAAVATFASPTSPTANAWNLGSTTLNSTNYTLKFAQASSGPWSANPSPATGYTFAQVTVTSAVLQLYFMPIISNSYTQNVNASAVGGLVAIPAFREGLGPFSAVAPDPNDPVNFGLTVGQSYDIEWPNVSAGAQCTQATPEKCFNNNKQPCTGDLANPAGMWAVANTWGSTHGFWGQTSASVIRQEILDLTQSQTVTVGQTLNMSGGDKTTEGTALDQRANQDTDLSDCQDPSDGDVLGGSRCQTNYQSNPLHNGRRYIGLPVLTPTGSSTALVVGLGAFLLITDGSPSGYYASSSGGQARCAIYAGPYKVGGDGPGAGNGGAYRVALIQ